MHSIVISRRLPFLNDDDDGTQQKDEDNQTSGTHPENQTHLLIVLGHLQSRAVILAGREKQKHGCTFKKKKKKRHNANTGYK